MYTNEALDKSIYDSMKSMFETLLLSTIQKAAAGEDWQSHADKLITVFNDTADSNLRMLRELREQPLTAPCECATASEQHKE